MLRIAGVDLPEEKKIPFALRYIYGVGPKVAAEIVKQANLSVDKRARDLTSEEIGRIQTILDHYMTEGDLKRKVADDVDRLKRIKSYRGMRHAMGLPARGQRTRTNSRTVRGNKRQTIGSMTKEMASKLEEAKKG
ncbi:MAG: 30S ribosomal protein S13 [bacterium]|nr:30S ribosomal protein S13 [bacterium]